MILNVYKPKGPTSFSTVAKTKLKYNVKKAGHAGTLDPLAEGVLIVLTEEDTKRQNEFMKQTKEYEAEIAFGAESPTFDLEHLPKLGRQTTIQELKQKLPEIVKKYVGEVEQTIPVYSAKKINGKPMYKLARKGKLLQQDQLVKSVKIDGIEILSFGERNIDTNEGAKVLPYANIKVVCSSGTFIRALANDFGKDLGSGAVMISLVRTKIGEFSIKDSLKL